jgi:hypothetical protein
MSHCQRIRRCFFLILAVVGLMLAAGAPARAQAPDIAEPEDVALAFYKVAGLRPAFAVWAEESERYHLAPVARRPRVLAEEAGRLLAAYNAYDPANDLLNVSTTALVTLREEPDPDNITRSRHFLLWDLDSKDGDIFPYAFRDTTFALVPHKLDSFKRAPISADQHRYLAERLGGTLKRARMVLHMRGQYADAQKPITMYGHDVWALVTLMAGVSLWADDGGILWEKSADWYVSPQTRALNDLKEDQDGGG